MSRCVRLHNSFVTNCYQRSWGGGIPHSRTPVARLGGPSRIRCCHLPCGVPPRAARCEYALPYGSAGTRQPWFQPSADSPVPAAGDWLSGRAPRSHRGGHWFDPSIAHQVRGYVDLHQVHDGSHSCSQVVSEPVRCRPWRAGVAGAKTASTSITRGSAATLRPIGIVRAAGVALSV